MSNLLKRGLVIDCSSDNIRILVRYGRRVSWQIPSSLQNIVTVRRSFMPSLMVQGTTSGTSNVMQNVRAGGAFNMSASDAIVAGRSISSIPQPTNMPTVSVTIGRSFSLRTRNFGGVIATE